MPLPESESPHLHLERARDRLRLMNYLVRRLLAGGVPSPGVIVEGVKKVK
jgi:hypothetical protein